MKKNYFGLPLIIAAILLSTVNLQAQVTVGSEIPPTRAALLELKTQQKAGTASGPAHQDNATSGANGGGLLLPRVELEGSDKLMPFIPDNDPDLAELKIKLTGLMVYNIKTVGVSLYPGLYIWNGSAWTTSQANPAAFAIAIQPKAFTFYEQGTETADPLTFSVAGGETPYTYQWHQLISNNVHVRVGVPVTAGDYYTTASYTPTQVLKGTTNNANNTGFYRFYCVATDANGVELTSDVAEVAVGCGAKTKDGRWLSFMCFNLGADALTIEQQKTYTIDLDAAGFDPHTYVQDEEKLYGDLFQWGRIADGHEDRQSGEIEYTSINTTTDLVNGVACLGSNFPYYQIGKGTTGYGKFIKSSPFWAPEISQSSFLWSSSYMQPNDPCTHYQENGQYQEFWNNCLETTATTGWRVPSQGEFGELFLGGALSGNPTDAQANTWVWISTNGRGYELRPDGFTPTLFLPANGYRTYPVSPIFNLRSQGEAGYYWSNTAIGTNSYLLNVSENSVSPGAADNRAFGFGIRCIKN
jgi:hypothetical protein